MTTEDDFQAALDAHPDDWQTRLVFADWLEERGDSRAEGYRAIGRLIIGPRAHPTIDVPLWGYDRADLPWYDELRPQYPDSRAGRALWDTRRAAEDAAALAFARLPAARRTELLTGS